MMPTPKIPADLDYTELVEVEHIKPVHAAAKTCMSAVDKLTGLVTQLEDRLDPVRLRGPEEDEGPERLPQQGASRLTMDLRGCATGIQLLQRRLGVLLDELEV